LVQATTREKPRAVSNALAPSRRLDIVRLGDE
jgi:hypothetical protein